MSNCITTGSCRIDRLVDMWWWKMKRINQFMSQTLIGYSFYLLWTKILILYSYFSQFFLNYKSIITVLSCEQGHGVLLECLEFLQEALSVLMLCTLVVYGSDCRYLPYSIYFSEFMPISPWENSFENTWSHTKMSVDGLLGAMHQYWESFFNL